jgi:hypothetical protein
VSEHVGELLGPPLFEIERDRVRQQTLVERGCPRGLDPVYAVGPVAARALEPSMRSSSLRPEAGRLERDRRAR